VCVILFDGPLPQKNGTSHQHSGQRWVETDVPTWLRVGYIFIFIFVSVVATNLRSATSIMSLIPLTAPSTDGGDHAHQRQRRIGYDGPSKHHHHDRIAEVGRAIGAHKHGKKVIHDMQKHAIPGVARRQQHERVEKSCK
jgi:hypothetical protein